VNPPGTQARLSDVLSNGIVRTGFRCADVEEAVRTLLLPLLSREGLSGDAVAAALKAVLNRECQAPTLVGAVALPHARIAGLGRIVAGLGVNPSGVFADDDPVRLVLAFATPAGASAEHLKFLARAAQLLRDEESRGLIVSAWDPMSLLAAIRSRER
jgi:mannitol/fructose-specific phosphotransferase system IIA component (Ntr-type)